MKHYERLYPMSWICRFIKEATQELAAVEEGEIMTSILEAWGEPYKTSDGSDDPLRASLEEAMKGKVSV